MPEPRIQFELSKDPFQAIGKIDGREFYFHARHSNWRFEIADDLGGLPSDTGGNPVFRVDGRFPMVDPIMTEEDATTIIRRCATLFVEIGRT
jgi:hypothetical protein